MLGNLTKRINDGHVRLWTVIGGVTALVGLLVTVVIAVVTSPGGSPSGQADRVGVSGTPDEPGGGTPGAVAKTTDPAASAPGYPTVGATPTPGPQEPDTSGVRQEFNGQVRIKSGTGVDLEAGQSVGERADGPNGDIDLHYDVAAGLRANGGDLYPDTGPASGAHDRCVRAVGAELDGRDAAAIYGSGDQYCFRTSKGHIGWLRVNDRSGIHVEQVVVLNVTVWADQ